jgi:hypothetical protein
MVLATSLHEVLRYRRAEHHFMIRSPTSAEAFNGNRCAGDHLSVRWWGGPETTKEWKIMPLMLLLLFLLKTTNLLVEFLVAIRLGLYLPCPWVFLLLI